MVDAVVSAGEAGTYVHWGVIQIGLTNLVIIVAMVLVFVLALALPFPHGARAKKPGRRP